MVSNLDRSWIIIEPTVPTTTTANSSNSCWTSNSFINLNRMLGGSRYNILNPDLFKTKASAYYLVSMISCNMEKEFQFIEYAHSQGSKVVLAISIDGRFLSGHGLCDPLTGKTHTELCDKVDAIASGIADDLHIYGRNQHKVFPIGDFVEHLNFETKKYEDRTIDLLGTGIVDETSLTFNIILFEMLKEKYPEKRFVYAFRGAPEYLPTIDFMQKKYPQIEFTNKPFHSLLKDSKCYVNIETRPRAGRAVLEAWYHRVPSISCTSTYFAKLYPELSFYNMSFDRMVDNFGKLNNSSYYEIMKTSDSIMEYDYADVVYKRMINMLDKGEI